MYEYEEWFDKEFFAGPEDGTEKGSVRGADSVHYYSMAVTLSRLYGREGNLFCDYGCGMGWTVRHLHNLGEDAYGVDISKYAADNAITDRIYHGDIRKPLESDFVSKEKMPDVLVCDRILCYLKETDINKAFTNIVSVMDPKHIVLTLVMKDFYTEGTPSYEQAFVGRRTVQSKKWWIEQMTKAGLWKYYDRALSTYVGQTNGWYGFFAFDLTGRRKSDRK